MNKIKNILIADDNDEIREIVRVLLESEGYNVSEAIDGEDAVNKVDETIDLVILDIMMPIKSGFKACVEIREKTSAPILFLTAKTQDSDKYMAFSAGSDDYLSKPFSYTELVSRVKALLRRYYVYKGKEQVATPDTIRINELTINTTVNEVYMECFFEYKYYYIVTFLGVAISFFFFILIMLFFINRKTSYTQEFRVVS